MRNLTLHFLLIHFYELYNFTLHIKTYFCLVRKPFYCLYLVTGRKAKPKKHKKTSDGILSVVLNVKYAL